MVSRETQPNSVFAENVRNAVGKDMYEMETIVTLCLIGLFTGGHILLEGNPGLGKTELVKALSKTLGLKYNRIQFTPDLMPADITGTYTRDVKNDNEWSFRPGRVFTNLLLADEINRATQKTQSAMLEVMAEQMVTPPGDVESYWLNGSVVNHDNAKPEEPFMVLATQNPIDHEGTYTLPQAQIDRFMFKVMMHNPSRDTLNKIVVKQTSDHTPSDEMLGDNLQYSYRKGIISNTGASSQLGNHILNIVQATNMQSSNLVFSFRNSAKAEEELLQFGEWFQYGLGPRSAIGMMNASKGWHVFQEQSIERTGIPTTEATSSDLMQIVRPTLRHRLLLHFDWLDRYKATDPEKRWQVTGDNIRDDEYRELLIADICRAAAPEKKLSDMVTAEFQRQFANGFLGTNL